MNIPRIAITPGEPAGVGPDVTIMAAQTAHDAELVVIGDPDLLKRRASALELPLKLELLEPTAKPQPQEPCTVKCLPIPLATQECAGSLEPHNANYVLQTLQTAADGCLTGSYSAMVTAPVQKSVINDAGIVFSGHTEFLAAATGTKQVVMLLATSKMRVALATTHIPLKDVPTAINRSLLLEKIGILHRELQQKFGLTKPQIAILGLNPHAGEKGHMGREEIDIIIPAVEHLQRQGMRLLGPLPADTAFNSKVLEKVDAVLAMYHDQGLPVLKYSGFGDAINITLGLPIIRTSVDHGTALDIAGTGKAECASMNLAIRAAIDISNLTA